MYRRYYSYSDMPELVRHDEEPKKIHTECDTECVTKTECSNASANQESNKLFGKFEIDDVILAVIILALLLDDSDDSLLLIALAFVFLTGLL